MTQINEREINERAWWENEAPKKLCGALEDSGTGFLFRDAYPLINFHSLPKEIRKRTKAQDRKVKQDANNLSTALKWGNWHEVGSILGPVLKEILEEKMEEDLDSEEYQ